MKRYMAGVLAGLCIALTVRAAGDMNIAETMGCVVAVEGQAVRVVGEPLTPGGLRDVWVDMAHGSVYDLRTGLRVAPAHVAQLPVGTTARIAYMPGPQEPLHGVVLWLHGCHPQAAVFSAVASEDMYREADYCTFLSVCGKFRIVLDETTDLYDPARGALCPTGLLPGQELFIWVDSITASTPALVYPHRAVVVR